MDISLLVQLSILGIVVGFAAGLLGIGGGGILVPVLTGIFITQQIAPTYGVHLALGTSMACIMTTTFSSAFSHYKHHNVEWFYVKALVPTIVVGAISISFLIPFINSEYLAIFFAIFMFLMAIKMFANPSLPSDKPKKINIAPSVAGLGIGGISTVVAIGGGVLVVPYLVSKGLNIKRAIGSSSAVGFPIAVSGTIGYAINGYLNAGDLAENADVIGFVHIPTVLIVSFWGLFLAPVGAKLSNKLPISVLKKIFALLMVGLSIKMLMIIFSP